MPLQRRYVMIRMNTPLCNISPLHFFCCSSAIEAIMLAVRDLPGDSYSDLGIYSDSATPPQRHRLLTLLASFLDDEHLHLRLCCLSASPTTSTASTATDTVPTATTTASDSQQVSALEEHMDSLVI